MEPDNTTPATPAALAPAAPSPGLAPAAPAAPVPATIQHPAMGAVHVVDEGTSGPPRAGADKGPMRPATPSATPAPVPPMTKPKLEVRPFSKATRKLLVKISQQANAEAMAAIDDEAELQGVETGGDLGWTPNLQALQFERQPYPGAEPPKTTEG